jgi:hypothetical protein
VTALAAVVDRLRDHGTSFALVGAAALAVHGVPRSTRDLDLLTVDVRCLDAEYWRSIGAGAIEVSVRRGDAADPLAGVTRLRPVTGAPVDVVVGRSAWQRAVIERAQPATIDDVVVPVAQAADLALLKLFAGGPQDLWDIAQLLSGDDAGAIAADVEGRLSSLPADCARLWTQVSRSRGHGS